MSIPFATGQITFLCNVVLTPDLRYIHINNIWDRIEKCLYLVIDAFLNWYFIKIVKENLVANGLQKYNRLVRFNQRIIIVSLLMDVMIIGAMSIPNGFLYASSISSGHSTYTFIIVNTITVTQCFTP